MGRAALACIVVPGRLGLNIPNIDFSPDGRFVYGPSPDDGTVSKWETSTGREAIRFKFSPNAAKRGQLIAFRLDPYGRGVTAITNAFSSGSPDLVGTWETESGKLLTEKPLNAKFDPFFRLNFSPDGRWIALLYCTLPLRDRACGKHAPEGHVLMVPSALSRPMADFSPRISILETKRTRPPPGRPPCLRWSAVERWLSFRSRHRADSCFTRTAARWRSPILGS